MNKEKLIKYWVVQKRRKISLNFYSLPMMFGSNLKRRERSRCLVDAFGGC
jgi:hypothetical protein